MYLDKHLINWPLMWRLEPRLLGEASAGPELRIARPAGWVLSPLACRVPQNVYAHSHSCQLIRCFFLCTFNPLGNECLFKVCLHFGGTPCILKLVVLLNFLVSCVSQKHARDGGFAVALCLSATYLSELCSGRCAILTAVKTGAHRIITQKART